MKNTTYKTLLLSLLLITTVSSFGQNTLGKTEDLGRIILSTYIPAQVENLPDGARSMLINKLNQISTKNGLGGARHSSRFIITANIVVVTKDLVESAPPMTALNLEVTFYIGDGIDGTKFSSHTIAVKGVGTNENKAYMQAINNIKPEDANLKEFINEGKQKVVEFYNYKCDVIIKEAQVLEAQNQYNEAIQKLTAVPEICKDCYEKCMTAVAPIYKKYMDRQCKIALIEARNTWASSQNSPGAASVARILSTIDPDAACYNDATALSKEVGKKVFELEKRNWDFKMKVYDQSLSIQKQRIAAYRDIGVAYGNGQPKSIAYSVLGWW